MVNLLKTFGKGILYILGFPFFIVALLIFGVIGIFLFIFQLFKSIIYFFTGQKFFPELPEDKELRLRQEAAFAAANSQPIIDQDPIIQNDDGQLPPPVIQEAQFNEEPAYEKPIYIESKYRPLYDEPSTSEPVQEEAPKQEEIEPETNIEAESVEEACFEQDQQEEPEIEETDDEDVLSELARNEPEHSIDTSSKEEEPVDDEPLEEYVPKGSTYIDEIEEDDASVGGVDIDYDVR